MSEWHQDACCLGRHDTWFSPEFEASQTNQEGESNGSHHCHSWFFFLRWRRAFSLDRRVRICKFELFRRTLLYSLQQQQHHHHHDQIFSFSLISISYCFDPRTNSMHTPNVPSVGPPPCHPSAPGSVACRRRRQHWRPTPGGTHPCLRARKETAGGRQKQREQRRVSIAAGK